MFTAFLSQPVEVFGGLFFLFEKFYTNLSYPTGHIMLVKKKSPFAFGDLLVYIIDVFSLTLVIDSPSKGQAEMSAFYLKKTSIPSGETWTESRTLRHSVRLFSRVRLSYIERQPLFKNWLR